ncbi:MAG: hypothetical protein ACYS9X_25215, partial [Planctomycetota bacterium]
MPEFQPFKEVAPRDARATLEVAERRARALIVEARREAGRMARRQIEEAFAAGREEGLARGMAEGREAAGPRAVEAVRE